jgi:hypothetical protein
MENLFETVFGLFTKYFWLFGLAPGIFYYFNICKPSPENKPDGQSEDKDCIYLRRFAAGMCLPWAIMGAGQLLGYTPVVWYYFRPQDLNPFVLAFITLVFVEICIFAWWVLFAGGAEKVRDLGLIVITMTGQPDRPVKSLVAIKLFAAISVLVFIACVALMVFLDIQVSK